MSTKKGRSLRPGSSKLHPTLASVAASIAGDSHSQEPGENTENSAVVAGRKRQAKADPCLGYDWSEEYQVLCERFSDKRVAAYVAWAASPMQYRKPAKLIDLAALLGLKTDRTIRQWREKDETIDQVIGDLQASPLHRYRRDIYEALVESARLEGSAGHADRRLALEMLGDYIPKSKQETSTKAPAVTSDEMAEAARQLSLWETANNSSALNG